MSITYLTGIKKKLDKDGIIHSKEIENKKILINNVCILDE